MIANTEWYRVFLHAAETSNLTKAAQNLHMTQPSVSYAIKQLEEALGVGLFDRLSKGVRLTQEGHALYQHVRQAFDELDSAERRLKNLKQFGEGRLRIGANGAIVKDFLLSLLDRFHARYPDIRIQLSQERTSSIVERLKKGSLDLGFVHLPVSDEEIHIIDSRTSPYCAVVGTAFADWARRPLRTEELTELPSCCYPWQLDALLHRRVVPITGSGSGSRLRVEQPGHVSGICRARLWNSILTTSLCRVPHLGRFLAGASNRNAITRSIYRRRRSEAGVALAGGRGILEMLQQN